jgi:hypothetical protein
MLESQAPVEVLSAALVRIAERVGHCGGGLPTRERELLAQDIAMCVESLQFHDRLMQQLSQVRNLLSSVATGTAPAGGDSSWQVLMDNLRSRFTSDTHRILFNILLPPDGSPANAATALHANEGSIELF